MRTNVSRSRLLLSAGLAGALVSGLVGCSDDDDGGADPQPSNPPIVPSATPPPPVPLPSGSELPASTTYTATIADDISVDQINAALVALSQLEGVVGANRASATTVLITLSASVTPEQREAAVRQLFALGPVEADGGSPIPLDLSPTPTPTALTSFGPATPPEGE